jgi:Raf kinase inhibitor-like YbhB/YbcL family protein
MGFSLRVLAAGGSVLAALAVAGAASAAPVTHAISGHAAAGSGQAAATKGQAAASRSQFHPFTVVSPNFRDGTFLPVSSEFGGPGSAGSGCSGKNLAPTVRWFNVPAGTKSFALTINDVDAPVAGGFHHWIVYNIPPAVTALAGHGKNPFSEGTNSYGTIGYGGPCPPPTFQVHHYIFTVYALTVSHVPGTHITFEKLLSEIAPDVAGATSVIGKFRLPLGG